MSEPGGETLRDRLTKATLLLIVIAFLSRILGFLRDAVIAYKFGLGDSWDAYNTAIGVPDILNYLVAGGTLSSTFVPLFREYWQRERQSTAWAFFAVVSGLMLVLVVGLVIAFELFSRPLVMLLFGHGGKSDEWLTLVVRITRIILPAQIFFVVGGLINGVIYSIRGDDKWYVAVPTIGSVVYNVAIIAGGLVLGPRVGIEGFAWGGLIGAFVGPFAMVTLAATRAGAPLRFRLDLRHPGIRRYLALTLPLMIGVSYSFVDQIIARVFGTHLSSGTIAALGQANRLMLVPVGVFGLSAVTASIGTLAAMAAERDLPGFRRQIREALSRVGIMILPVTALMIVLAAPIVHVLLQRGKFDAEATVRVASLLCWYALGMYGWSVNYILARGLYSLQDTITPAVLGTLTTALMIPLSWVLMRWMGPDGLALAATIGITVQTLAIFEALRRKLQGLETGTILRSLGRTTAASALMGAACWGISLLLHAAPVAAVGPLSHLAPASGSVVGALVEIALVSVVGIPLFAWIALRLGEEEAAYLWGKVIGKAKRLVRLG